MDYTDESPMPFGKHIGKKLKDIPYTYLLWLFGNIKGLDNGLYRYIQGRAEQLKNKTDDKE